MVAPTKDVKPMEPTIEKKEEMRNSEELLKNAPAKKELAQAAMSGFFAGILSREAMTPEKSA